MSNYQLSQPKADDKEDWQTLFKAYADFYKTQIEQDAIDRVWAWLQDPDHQFEGLLVRNESKRVIGFVHFRACPRSLSGGEIGFVDDLFIAPDVRGSGAADAVIAELQSIALQRGWSFLRWITQHFNERGRGFYDKYTSGPSDFIVYQLSTAPK